VVKEELTNMSEEESMKFEPVLDSGMKKQNRFEDRAGVADLG